MNFKIDFESKVSERIWDNYLNRIQKLLKKIPKDQKEELLLEIKSHLYESIQNDTDGKEEEKVLNAIERMGDPEDFIKPLIADKLLLSASKTMKPNSVFLSLVYKSFINIKYAFGALLFSIGYSLSFILIVIAFFKIITPSNIGFYKLGSGKFEFSMFSTAPQTEEILGYWIVLIGLLAAVLIYVLLTKLLKLLISKK